MLRAAILGFLGCAFLTAAPATAATLRRSFTFAVDDHGRWSGELVALRRELHPVVPVRLARLLLPEGATVKAATFVPAATRRIRYAPELAGRLRPLSGADDDRTVAAWTGDAYPAAWQGETRVERFRGQRILSVALYPLRVSSDGTAEVATGGELLVELEDGYAPAAEPLRRTLARDRAEAAALAGEPYAPVPYAPEDEPTGYLILGPASLVGGEGPASPLAALIADKRARGLKVEVATLEQAAPGGDPEAIRRFLTGKYKADGVDYVLLVGDDDRLPWKKLRSGMGGSGDPVPSDQYYACLDGDFSKVAAYDWACELAVGRIGAKTQADVAAWVAKTLALQELVKEGRTRDWLHFGERLDGSTLGGWALDFIVKGRGQQPATKGLPSSLAILRLHEGENGATPDGDDFIAKTAEGDFHVVNHLGHSNETYTLSLEASRIDELRGRPAFIYTQGCYPNDPDADNWTIRAVRAPEFGPAAMIANTRYGWYEPGRDGEGTSAVLHRNFWAMRFERGILTLGRMNHAAKALVVAADDGDTMIYTALESNLIGDPELDLGVE